MDWLKTVASPAVSVGHRLVEKFFLLLVTDLFDQLRSILRSSDSFKTGLGFLAPPVPPNCSNLGSDRYVCG